MNEAGNTSKQPTGRDGTAGGPGHSTMLLQVIARERSRLPRAELRIADFVLQHPESVITMNMADLKAVTGVSDPTIIRFARRLHCSGYPELKVFVLLALSVPVLIVSYHFCVRRTWIGVVLNGRRYPARAAR